MLVSGCQSSSLAGALSFISQSSILGGEVWFGIISHDLQMGYKDPFSSFSQKQYLYSAVVLLMSIGSSCILMALGPSAYGVSSEGSIWIQDTDTKKRTTANSYGLNYPKIALFFVPLAFIYCYCTYTVWDLRCRLKVGFGDTLGVRKTIIERSRDYIFGYLIYW